MSDTPAGSRLHVGLLGRRNVGKSSLLNAITGQQTAIVADHPGTTTDPVFKPMELLPLGPVMLVDTPGFDDDGALGELRIARTREVLARLDLALLVAEATGWGLVEERLLAELRQRDIPTVIVLNKADLDPPGAALLDDLRGAVRAVVVTVATRGQGLDNLRAALLEVAPGGTLQPPPLVADLVPAGGCAVLVVPIDREAPRGRLILPQAQVIRDLLDHGCLALVTRDDTLAAALALLPEPPALVVTDAQAFAAVAAVTPPQVLLTAFSVLLSRHKGDLLEQARGARAVETLRPGDLVLVAEACTHHPVEDDIGRVKIPRWLQEHVGGPLRFEFVRGRDFPDDLGGAKLVVHCGACMWTRRAVLERIVRCRKAGVPITNYGLLIAQVLGILPRALGPFAGVWEQASSTATEAGPGGTCVEAPGWDGRRQPASSRR